jgi:Fe-S-cluster-containing hydrogenase component 2
MKRITIDHFKCIGCRICELVCSIKHERRIGYRTARIRVTQNELKGISFPVVCKSCDERACVELCPTKALYEDLQTQAIIVRESLCIACELCIEVCPYGAIFPDPTRDSVLVCDLCGGDPVCAKYCPTQALKYLRPSDTS